MLTMKNFSIIEHLKAADRKDWATAQSIATFGMSLPQKKSHEKRSWERFERIKSGETTLEDEEAVLLMQWRALNNLSKNRE
jgi:hypothetical protein